MSREDDEAREELQRLRDEAKFRLLLEQNNLLHPRSKAERFLAVATWVALGLAVIWLLALVLT